MSVRVLVVDDSAVFRRVVTDALAGIPGVELAGSAANGRLALNRMAALEPDLVTLDIEMPEMNGLEFWNELEQARPDLALRTVFISGGITSETLHLGVSDTGRPCLSKPVDIAELVRTIRRLGRPFEDLGR